MLSPSLTKYFTDHGFHRRYLILEKQSALQISPYWLNVQTHPIIILVWVIKLRKGLIFELHITYKERGVRKKALCCNRQNYTDIDILWYYFFLFKSHIGITALSLYLVYRGVQRIYLGADVFFLSLPSKGGKLKIRKWNPCP